MPETYTVHIKRREDRPATIEEHRELRTRIEFLMTALRRIRSLDEKNVPKYAQQIAREALERIEKS